MPFVFEEDEIVPVVPKGKNISAIAEEYDQLVKTRNKPVKELKVVRNVGRPNVIAKLSGRKRRLTKHFVMTNVIDYDTYNDFQIHRMVKSSLLSHRFPSRCYIGKHRLFSILRSELHGRVENYLNNNDMKKKKIMCIIGESGVGKTLASLHLQNKLSANVVCSYTTRPPRETEVEGREHHFVDIVPPPEEILAFTCFAKHKYYATKAQIHGDCTVYVIDEAGVVDLKSRWGDEYEIYTVYIQRNRRLRLQRRVDTNRMARDARRMRLDMDYYDYVVTNNSTKRIFFEEIERIYNEIKNK